MKDEQVIHELEEFMRMLRVDETQFLTKENRQSFLNDPAAMDKLRQVHASFKERAEFETSCVRLTLRENHDIPHVSTMSVYAFNNGEEEFHANKNNVRINSDGSFDKDFGEISVIIHQSPDVYLEEVSRLRREEASGSRSPWGGHGNALTYLTYTVSPGENRIVVDDRRPEEDKTPVYAGFSQTELIASKSQPELINVSF